MPGTHNSHRPGALCGAWKAFLVAASRGQATSTRDLGEHPDVCVKGKYGVHWGSPTVLHPDQAATSTLSASTPETWAKFTQDILLRAERERLASVNLRKLIDCILRDTAEDLRLQCDAVNTAFSSRCEELDDARQKLQYHLQKVGPQCSPAFGHAHLFEYTQDMPTSEPIPCLGHTYSHLCSSPSRPRPQNPRNSERTLGLHSSHAHPLPRTWVPLTTGTRVAIHLMLKS